MMLGDLDTYMQKMKLNHQLTPHTKINSRWMKDLNISHNTIKVLQEHFSRKISNIPHSNIFTDTSPKARDIKERINKWDLIKKKKKSASLWLNKTPLKWKGNQPYGKTYLPMIHQTRDWSPQYIKNLYGSTQEDKQYNYKMGKEPKQTLLQGGHTEGLETYERMLNITSHQRDAN